MGDLDGGGVLLEPLGPLCALDRREADAESRPLAVDPRQGDLRGGMPFRSATCATELGDRLVGMACRTGKAWVVDAEVLVSQRVGLDRAGQEPSAEWGVGFSHAVHPSWPFRPVRLASVPGHHEFRPTDPGKRPPTTPTPRPTWRSASPKDAHDARSDGASNAISPDISTEPLNALHDTPRRLEKHRSVDYEEPGKGDHGFRGSHDAATARKSLLFMISFAQHPVLRPTVSLRPGHKLDAHRPFRQRCLLTRLQTIAGFAKSARHNPNRSPYSRPRCHLLPGHIALAEP